MITIYADGPIETECYVVVLWRNGQLHITDWSEYGMYVLANLMREGALPVMSARVPMALAGREREELCWLGTGYTRNRRLGGDFASKIGTVPGRTGRVTVADLMAAL